MARGESSCWASARSSAHNRTQHSNCCSTRCTGPQRVRQESSEATRTENVRGKLDRGETTGLAMLPFALTIFLSAFLLFQVQLLLAKFILPWFGGSPAVWATCNLFFAGFLLGGYAYGHLISTRLTPQAQKRLHQIGLLASLAVLGVKAAVWKSLLTHAKSLQPANGRPFRHPSRRKQPRPKGAHHHRAKCSADFGWHWRLAVPYRFSRPPISFAGRSLSSHFSGCCRSVCICFRSFSALSGRIGTHAAGFILRSAPRSLLRVFSCIKARGTACSYKLRCIREFCLFAAWSAMGNWRG